MNKSKKLTQLLDTNSHNVSEYIKEKDIVTVDELYKALAKLVKVFTSGKASDVQNPYTRPEVKDALKILAQQSGITSIYDVDLDKFIKG